MAVSAAVELGEKSYIYWGLIDDYFFRKGKLDKLSMKGTRKIVISKEIESTENEEFNKVIKDVFHDIKGDFFIIDYKDVKNLNVDYMPEDTDILL